MNHSQTCCSGNKVRNLRRCKTISSSISLLCVYLHFIDKCSGFALTNPSSALIGSPSRHFLSSSSSILFAKPLAKSQFDLDKIEAFEESLEKPIETVDGKDNAEHDVDEEDSLDEITTFEIPTELHNTRIDAALASLDSSLSRSNIGTLIKKGCVCILSGEGNGKPEAVTKKSVKVEEGQMLQVVHKSLDNKPTEIIPEDIPLEILFEDEHMIVVNKAAGMVVHPAAGNWAGTLVNALAHYLPNVSTFGSGEFVGDNESMAASIDGTDGEVVFFRPGIVHRLDKGTTGIIVVAKTKSALTALSAAFANRKVRKTYVTITVGNPGKRVVIDKPIGRHPIHRQKMRVVPDPTKKNSGRFTPTEKGLRTGSLSQTGRRALSFVDTKAFDGKLSVAEVRIETGRTHQIRVHLQDRHTPVYGDEVYGISDWNKKLTKQYGVSRPLLHAHRLEIAHPVTGEKMVLQAPMAEDMTKIADLIWPEGRAEQPALFR